MLFPINCIGLFLTLSLFLLNIAHANTCAKSLSNSNLTNFSSGAIDLTKYTADQKLLDGSKYLTYARYYHDSPTVNARVTTISEQIRMGDPATFEAKSGYPRGPFTFSEDISDKLWQKALAANFEDWQIDFYIAFNKLHPAERAAIRTYTNIISYQSVNKALRSQSSDLLDEEESFIKVLVSALNKLPKKSGRVFRGLKFNNKTDAEIEAFVERYKIGEEIVEPSFLSSTSIASSEWVQNKIVLVIDSVSAVPILSQMTVFPADNELLIGPGRQFFVTDIKRGSVKSALDVDTSDIVREDTVFIFLKEKGFE